MQLLYIENEYPRGGEGRRLLLLLVMIIIRIMGAFLKVRLRDSYEQHDGLCFANYVLSAVKTALFSFCYHFLLGEGVLTNVYS